MKSTLLFAGLLLSLQQTTLAQSGCDGTRYREPVFSEVKVTKDVEFGAGAQLVDVGGPMYTPVIMTQTLYMDIYEPMGDVQENRPMIILAFGGAFVFGTRTDAYMVDLCTRYAQLGYVTASIDYRLTRELATAGLKLDPAIAPKAVLKGTHDMRASIRYMNSTIANGNPYHINPEQIYVGGVSAGAFCALHAAYLDKDSEIPEELAAYAAENGGLEGLSGNPGFSSKVAGVISFSGALGKAEWLEAGDVPIVSTHGTNDDVVPYGSDSVTILMINYPVDGSSVIHERASEIGVTNAFYTYYGAAHAQEATNDAYRDTGFAFSRDFMFEQVCNAATSGISNNQSTSGVSLYPNPANTSTSIEGLSIGNRVAIYSTTGQLLSSETANTDKLTLDLKNLEKGLYLIRVTGNSKTSTHHLLVD